MTFVSLRKSEMKGEWNESTSDRIVGFRSQRGEDLSAVAHLVAFVSSVSLQRAQTTSVRHVRKIVQSLRQILILVFTITYLWNLTAPLLLWNHGLPGNTETDISVR